MHADFKDKNVVFFAITFDEKEKVERFLKKFPIDFHVVPQGQKTIDQFGVSFFPTNIILNPEGTVVYVNEFFMKDMIKDMRKTIKKLVQ
jgi:peroxiredoxin